MTPDTKPPRGRLLKLSDVAGERLVELAVGHGVSVADYFDREFGGLVAERWRAMLAAKLRSADPAFANSLEGE